ncbi:hypothetical protein ACTXG6_04060 [Pseudonocardia sp. Cha107L01]|jgi:hypothetical protein|uniref:hypothetical protein n=1 Tax=Pseudonocardia sp. Cha107L01 TaxID=3457576 RepID=UPI00403ED790
MEDGAAARAPRSADRGAPRSADLSGPRRSPERVDAARTPERLAVPRSFDLGSFDLDSFDLGVPDLPDAGRSAVLPLADRSVELEGAAWSMKLAGATVEVRWGRRAAIQSPNVEGSSCPAQTHWSRRVVVDIDIGPRQNCAGRCLKSSRSKTNIDRPHL